MLTVNFYRRAPCSFVQTFADTAYHILLKVVCLEKRFQFPRREGTADQPFAGNGRENGAGRNPKDKSGRRENDALNVPDNESIRYKYYG